MRRGEPPTAHAHLGLGQNGLIAYRLTGPQLQIALVHWLLYVKRVTTRLSCVEGKAKQFIQAGASFHCVGVFWKLSSAWTLAHQSAKPSIFNNSGISGVSDR